MNNQDRFDILRGYYTKNDEYHPQGGPGICLIDLLNKLEFNDFEHFLNWYKSLTPNEITDGKKDWCPGDCCQSILRKLLKLVK